MRIKLAALLLLAAPCLFADLTIDQKLADFQQLAGLYAKNYAPYQWKRDVLGFDLYDVQPWIDQIRQSKTDLDYYDICIKYVASLQDSHDEFIIDSDFQAYLGFDVDIYDGAVLVDGINRSFLPSSKYPFQIGDEVASIDGIPAADFITKLIPYSVNGSANPSTRRRLAAGNISFRYQGWYIRAHEVGDSSTVVINRQNGNVETYVIPWSKAGTPVISAGPVTTPLFKARAKAAGHPALRRAREVLGVVGRGSDGSNPWGAYSGPAAESVPADIPEYERSLVPFQDMSGLSNIYASAGFGAIAPVFNPPAGFTPRLGSKTTDQFLSGTFVSGGHNFGFIRIYTMSPSNTSTALSQFQSEITYFQQNTDGLMIDLMRNGGGSLCYTERLAQMLIPHPFRGIPEIIRATDNWVTSFSSQYYNAIAFRAPTWQIQQYATFLQMVKQANSENRGDTGDVPLCYAAFETIPPATDQLGNQVAFTKPILVLQDEFTLSAAETMGALLKDANRATFFGVRSDGGGGNVVAFPVGVYSEGTARVTLGLETRASTVQTPGYPATNLFENVGIYPDIVQDYMTKDNLLHAGATFLNTAIAALKNLAGK